MSAFSCSPPLDPALALSLFPNIFRPGRYVHFLMEGVCRSCLTLCMPVWNWFVHPLFLSGRDVMPDSVGLWRQPSDPPPLDLQNHRDRRLMHPQDLFFWWWDANHPGVKVKSTNYCCALSQCFYVNHADVDGTEGVFGESVWKPGLYAIQI